MSQPQAPFGFCSADGAAMPSQAAAPMAPIPGWDNPAEWSWTALPMPAAGPLRGVLRELLRTPGLTSDGLLAVADAWEREATHVGAEAHHLSLGAELCRLLAPLYSDVALCPSVAEAPHAG